LLRSAIDVATGGSELGWTSGMLGNLLVRWFATVVMITAVRGNTKQKSWAVMAEQSATDFSVVINFAGTAAGID
jgi:hypothetical protein